VPAVDRADSRFDATSYDIILATIVCATAESPGLIGDLRVVRNALNLGFLRNCNNALRHARGRYVVYLKQRRSCPAIWVRSLRDTSRRKPNFGARSEIRLSERPPA